MSSLFLYPSIVQDDYPVGILDCFEPVGNDGASFNQRVDGFLHLHFIFWVERGGSFVLIVCTDVVVSKSTACGKIILYLASVSGVTLQWNFNTGILV